MVKREEFPWDAGRFKPTTFEEMFQEEDRKRALRAGERSFEYLAITLMHYSELSSYSNIVSSLTSLIIHILLLQSAASRVTLMSIDEVLLYNMQCGSL